MSDIKKGTQGAGTRGGRVLGYSKKTGKAIYESTRTAIKQHQQAKKKHKASTKGSEAAVKERRKKALQAMKDVIRQRRKDGKAKNMKKANSVETNNDCGGKHMKKSKEELTKQLLDEVKTGKLALEDVKKAITSDSLIQTNQAPAEPATAQTIEAQTATTEKTSEVAQTSTTVETQPVTQELTQEVKFANGLFQTFTVGTTLEQNPGIAGNVMHNLKQPKMDYVEAELKARKNLKITKEESKKK